MCLLARSILWGTLTKVPTVEPTRKLAINRTLIWNKGAMFFLCLEEKPLTRERSKDIARNTLMFHSPG